MPCYHQKCAHVAGVKANGKLLIDMGLPKKSGQRAFLFNCGHCIGCQKMRSQSWAYRMECQQIYYDKSCFITLTYSDKYRPQYGSVTREDVQVFLRSLRYYYPQADLKYYMTAEYGENGTERCHYHGLLFGVDFEDDRELIYKTNGIPHYHSPQLTKIWANGHAELGELTAASAAYCVQYCNKKLGGQRHWRDYETTDIYTGEIIKREPEFALMSQGLGKPFYQDFKNDIFPSDVCVTKSKKRIAVPTYFDKMYALENPDEYEKIKAARIERSLAPHLDKTHARLIVREKCAHLKIKQQSNKGALRQ